MKTGSNTLLELPPILKELCRIYERPELPPKIPPQIVESAKKAHVIELLGAKPGRKGNRKIQMEFLMEAGLGALRLKHFRRIATILNNAKLKFAPLKGMAYALLFETGGPSRAMGDFDILVHPEDFDKASNALVKEGFKPHYPHQISRAKGYYERCFLGDGINIDLHRGFRNETRLKIDYDKLWKRAKPFENDGISCMMLSKEDLFLSHIIHMGAGEFAIGLRYVWELEKLLVRTKPDMEICSEYAKRWGCLRMSYCSLRLLNICFPGRIDNEIMDMFTPHPAVQRLLEEFVIKPSIPLLIHPRPLPRPTQLFRKFLLVDRLDCGFNHLLWYLKAKFLTV